MADTLTGAHHAAGKSRQPRSDRHRLDDQPHIALPQLQWVLLRLGVMHPFWESDWCVPGFPESERVVDSSSPETAGV